MNIDEIAKKDIIIPKNFIQEELNPTLWIKVKDSYELKDEVHEKLIEIAQKFHEYLDIETGFEDIYFVGSMASFNWTTQSDIDLHLLFDYKKINNNKSIVEKYFDVKKKYWNDNHEIKIYGFDVELGCQEIGAPFFSKAVFSVKKNKWIDFPDKEKFSIDKNSLKNKILNLVNQIDNLEKVNDLSEKIELSGKIKDKIKKMRKSGLEKGGEFSLENLAFKYLRNNGYIGKLIKIKKLATDKKLSLPENEKIA